MTKSHCPTFKKEVDKNMKCFEESSTKALSQQRESRLAKLVRIEERKASFERNKRKRAEKRVARARERCATEIAHKRAATLSANAATQNFALQRRQLEQMDIFPNIMARKNNIEVEIPTSKLSALMTVERLPHEASVLSPDASAITDGQKQKLSQVDQMHSSK